MTKISVFIKICPKQIEDICKIGALTMKPNSDQPRWLSSKEAATYCNLGFSTLAKGRLTGDSPAYSKIGAKILYNVADLDAWLKSKRVANTSQYAA